MPGNVVLLGDLFERVARLRHVGRLQVVLPRVDHRAGKLVQQVGDLLGLIGGQIGVAVQHAQREMGLGELALVELLLHRVHEGGELALQQLIGGICRGRRQPAPAAMRFRRRRRFAPHPLAALGSDGGGELAGGHGDSIRRHRRAQTLPRARRQRGEEPTEESAASRGGSGRRRRRGGCAGWRGRAGGGRKRRGRSARAEAGGAGGPSGPPPNASGPPGGGDGFALGSSTFGAAGHPSATPGGWPGSALFRASDTYTPYPTAANTAMISKFFSEFMFVLLDESRHP